MIREIEDGRHQYGCDDEFRQERHPWPTGPGCRDDIPNGRVRDCLPEKKRHQRYAEHRSRELRDYIKERVPSADLAQPEKSECYGWVDVSTRLLAPRRINDGNSSHAHRHSHEEPS